MRRPPEIRLLGEGLDAIVIPAARPRSWWENLLGLRPITDERYLRSPSNAARLARYHDAALYRPMYRDTQLLELREYRGWNYLKSWCAGQFPKVGRFRSLMPIPSNTTTRRVSRARG